MRTVSQFLIVMIWMLGSGEAAVVYSNFGSGDSFSQVNGFTIGYPFGPNEVGQSVAFSFTPSVDTLLTSIDLAINADPRGANAFIVAIYNDLIGMPGSLRDSAIGAAEVTPHIGIPPSSITSVAFPGSTILTGGVLYWIGLHPAAAQPTDTVWWWNPDSDLKSTEWQSNTPTKVLIGGEWERTFNVTETAYRINGSTAIPESSTTGMLTLGLIGLVVLGTSCRGWIRPAASSRLSLVPRYRSVVPNERQKSQTARMTDAAEYSKSG